MTLNMGEPDRNTELECVYRGVRKGACFRSCRLGRLSASGNGGRKLDNNRLTRPYSLDTYLVTRWPPDAQGTHAPRITSGRKVSCDPRFTTAGLRTIFAIWRWWERRTPSFCDANSGGKTCAR